MSDDQEFIWGADLRSGLSKLNEHYALLSNDIKDKGVMSFAESPPKTGNFLVAEIWDKYCPGWREDIEHDNDLSTSTKLAKDIAMSFAGSPPKTGNWLVTKIYGKKNDVCSPNNLTLLREIKAMSNAPALLPEQVDFNPLDPDTLMETRPIRQRKGSWYQLPKSFV